MAKQTKARLPVTIHLNIEPTERFVILTEMGLIYMQSADITRATMHFTCPIPQSRTRKLQLIERWLRHAMLPGD